MMDLRDTEAKDQDPIRSIVQSQEEFCIECLNHVWSCLSKICGIDEIAYLDGLCTTFIKENSKDTIELHILKVDKLQVLIQKYENEVISLLGIRYAYKNINDVSKMFRRYWKTSKTFFVQLCLVVMRWNICGQQKNSYIQQIPAYTEDKYTSGI